MAEKSGFLSNLTTGNLVGAGISLIPSLFKGISSIFQGNKADDINPTDPQYQMNSGVISNAETLRNRAGNYMLPNYYKAQQDIDGTYSTAFNNGVQGASSSGDVLDLATKIAYGQANANNDLNARNAQGSENALMQSLDANAAEGREYQAKNAYDREQYMMQLREKAGLTQASNENAYGALDSLANVGSNLFMNPYNNSRSNVNSANPNALGSIIPTGEQYRQSLMAKYDPYTTR